MYYVGNKTGNKIESLSLWNYMLVLESQIHQTNNHIKYYEKDGHGFVIEKSLFDIMELGQLMHQG